MISNSFDSLISTFCYATPGKVCKAALLELCPDSICNAINFTRNDYFFNNAVVIGLAFVALQQELFQLKEIVGVLLTSPDTNRQSSQC